MFEIPDLKEIVRLGRPKFLLYTNIMYTVGAAAAYKTSPESTFHLWSYIWICLSVNAVHGMTEYFSEFYDYEADCAKKNHSPWRGESHVLVEGKVKPEVSLYIARVIALILLTNVVIFYAITDNIPLCITMLLGIILGHGYTAWPLRTSRRGLGEATVCLANVLLPLAGYQSLDPTSPLGCALLWPILLSLLPMQYTESIVMNMPDYEGDKIAGKTTLVVRLGVDLASKIHGVAMVFAYIFHVWLFYAGYISKLTFLLVLIPAPIGLRQIRNVLIRPWKFDVPLWSRLHNILSMAMALTAILLSDGRPLTGKSWVLVFPLVLISVSVPVLLMKMIDAAKAEEAKSTTSKEFSNEKDE